MKKSYMVALAAALLAGCSPQATHETATENTEAEAVSYVPTGWLAKSLPDIAAGLQSGEVTSVDLVQAYIERINAVDWSGPSLQSVLSINPDAMAVAAELDAKRAAGEIVGPLHGVPILLKDNIESADNLATTAGALALKDNITGRDSPLVAGLREAGAIILGKANLSQWANFRSNDSMSGWTALGGQVHNPHILNRNPCGSSSGSGSAAASSMAAGTVGTETNGSIICPSTVNGVVGFKPTVGLVSQQYIVPISSSQDTAGPMTKTVRGAAMMLNAMATGDAKTDYVAALDAGSLEGKRVGVLRFAEGSNADIVALFNAAVAELEAAGAILVEISDNPVTADGFGPSSRQVLYHEFKATLNEYLASTPDTVKTRTLDELIAFNLENADIELALFDQSIWDTSAPLPGLDDPEYIEHRDKVQKATREDGVDALIAEHNLDFMVSPSGPVPGQIDPINGDVWPSFPGAGWIAAIAGYPHATVPMGGVHGMPVGFSIMGAKDDDANILSYAYAYEQRTNLRLEPQYLPTSDMRDEIKENMKGYLRR
ncbi:MAG: amidase [Kordiimonadaceae bacterium]|nr:amidase [Kordiimonadaceae bacterium]MBO6568079.1 amidase [Kordiimonadaceae bacterium]MBO6964191.1 amidase [Kordiimonadaceae bacterium]